MTGVNLMREGECITEYELKLDHKIAQVLCGGNVTPGTSISEQYVLDLERGVQIAVARRRRRKEFSSRSRREKRLEINLANA
jgi:3-hydroxyacyl-CoA dehydrogenase